MAASLVWDNEYWYAIEARHVQSCREAGSLAQLALSVNGLAIIMVWQGDFAAAASLVAEAEAIAAATGTRFARYGGMLLAGYRGAEAEAAPLIEAGIAGARAAGHGGGVQWSQWVSAILYNGLGRYQTALAQAHQASEQSPELYTRMWALPELIEAASRTGQTQLATDALARLAEATSVALTDWGQGIYARSRALLSDGEDAETWYRQAVDRLNRTALRTELARTHLLYGEWLRREARGPTRARSCAPRTPCSTRSACRRSPSGPAASWPPPARLRASAPWKRTTSSRRKRLRSRSWRGRACPTRRSPPSCSSARARSNGTCAKYSPSSRSAPACNSSERCPTAPGIAKAVTWCLEVTVAGEVALG
jgi:tetratricopeptide (TPR) repeat protein